jgi:uncharacterized membrane protein YcaP (DUF421 family)
MNEVTSILIKTVVVYVVLLFTIRVVGKREIGNWGAFDFMVALMIGEGVGEMIYGDTPLWHGLLVLAVLAVLEWINSWGSQRSAFFYRLTSGSPTILVRDGKIDHHALQRERINQEELRSQLRVEGIEHVRQVKKATLEPDGTISVIKN